MKDKFKMLVKDKAHITVLSECNKAGIVCRTVYNSQSGKSFTVCGDKVRHLTSNRLTTWANLLRTKGAN